MALIIVNPSDKSVYSRRYVVSLGAYGWTRLLIWSSDVGSAIDEAIDWAAENAPGLLCDDAVNEVYAEAIANGKSEEEAQEEAQVDTVCGGNYGNYLNSWEVSVTENPDREYLKRLAA
jgi:hypothetical protein